ncbi:uncharacterized protein LOC120338710 [Styela clava]
MCAMSCVMRRCGHLEQVRLVKCELNAELLKNFEFNLKGSIVKVSEFDISLNPMSVEAFDIFGSVLTNIEVEKLVMRGCSLTEEKFRVLGRHSHLQIHILDVRNITNMTFDLYLAIVKFASEHDVKELLMDPWDCFNASKQQLLELSKWKVCGKISTLDVQNITNMTFGLYLAIVKVASKHDVKQLLMDPWYCFKASKVQLLELSKWKVCGKIRVLDVRNITNMTFDLYLAIVKFASEHDVKELLMNPWDCFEANKEQLLELSKWKICGKINVLDVRCITQMPCDLCLTITEFASRSGVKTILMDSLDFSKTNKEQLKKLSEYKSCGKISIIDISQNPMDEEDFYALGNLLSNYEVGQLIAINCQLTKAKLDALGSHSGWKIFVLDVRNITNMTFDLYLAIVKFASEHDVKKLSIDPWNCFVSSKEQLLELSKWKVCGKIQVLDVRNITNMTFDLYLAIAKIASKHDIKELLIDPWDYFKASEEQLLELSKWKVCGKINVLDVQSITQMSSDLCLTIYEIASQRGVKKILMDSLDFSKANKEQLKKLDKYKLCGKISVIDISQNSMDEEAFDALGDLLSNYEVDQLIAKNCQLTKAKLDALESHSGSKLSRIDISENSMDEKGFNALGSLLTTNNKVLHLVMQNCQLTKEKLDALGSRTVLKIYTLDIRSITGMTFDLFLAISKFATESEVKELLMDPWKEFRATKDQIMELSKWKVCGKLDVLNVTNNKDLGTAGFGKVGTVVSKCQVKELKSQNCNLTAEGIKAFKENTRNAKLNILDISLNKNLGIAGFGEVGTVVSKCQVKELEAWDCNLTAEEIKAFKENTRNAKLDKLTISLNKNLGTAGFGEVGLVVSKCQVKEFNAQGCNLTAEEIRAFKKNSRNAKVKTSLYT